MKAKRTASRIVEWLEALIATAVLLGLFLSCQPLMPLRSKDAAQLDMQMKDIHRAITEYTADCRRFPSRSEGLAALVTNPGTSGWRGPYLDEIPRDPWGANYGYGMVGGYPQTVSAGPDRILGSEDDLWSRY